MLNCDAAQLANESQKNIQSNTKLLLERIQKAIDQDNSQAQNFDFNKKKSAYFGGKQGISSYVLTTQVLNTPEWTQQLTEKRQLDLLGVLATKWDLKEKA